MGLVSLGPALLFVKTSQGKEEGRRFYACSACRDRKDCKFFQWEDEKVRGLLHAEGVLGFGWFLFFFFCFFSFTL